MTCVFHTKQSFHPLRHEQTLLLSTGNNLTIFNLIFLIGNNCLSVWETKFLQHSPWNKCPLICSIRNSTCPGQFSAHPAQNLFALANMRSLVSLTVFWFKFHWSFFFSKKRMSPIILMPPYMLNLSSTNNLRSKNLSLREWLVQRGHIVVDNVKHYNISGSQWPEVKALS